MDSTQSVRTFVGRCIYCPPETINQDLTDEHAGPDGLQGNFILEKASCAKHSDLTSYIERVTLRGMFAAVREHYGYHGKRRKQRPQLYVGFENADGTIEQQPVSLFEHPYILAMPVMAPPGILVGRAREAGFPPGMSFRIHTHDAARRRMAELSRRDPQQRNIYTPLDAGNLTKFLAKVGYCFAVFFMKTEFEPLVLDLILSPRGDAVLGPYFVGGPFTQPGAVPFPLPMERQMSTVVRLERVGATVYVIARIQLFNSRGMPVYDVVVGHSTEEALLALAATT